MMNDNHYTKDAYENNGRFQIHPLSSEGLEAYLSKDSYNYHYLKSKYDPALLKEIQQEVLNEREKSKISEQNNIINEQEKKAYPPILDINKDLKPQNTINICKQIKQVKQGSNDIKNKQKTNSVSQKINNLGKSVTPVICNVKNDRGKLGDVQQPYNA